MYEIDTFTYGTELEFADVDITNPLPEGCQWNKKDYSIVNSNGVANDPLGKTCKFGGEINTKPTTTIQEQLHVIDEIINILDPKPVINYKCNLHIHIGVLGLKEDLDMIKQIYSYSYRMDERIFDIIDPMPLPIKLNTEDSKLESKRYHRNLISHRKKPSSKRFAEVMASNTPQEFFENHATKDRNGKLCWAITPRDGINLRQLWETDTIEFRHFFGTLDLEEIKSCLVWCREFINLAINDPTLPPHTILKNNPNLKFPRSVKFDANLQRGYDLTNIAHHNRKQAMKNIVIWLGK